MDSQPWHAYLLYDIPAIALLVRLSSIRQKVCLVQITFRSALSINETWALQFGSGHGIWSLLVRIHQGSYRQIEMNE